MDEYEEAWREKALQPLQYYRGTVGLSAAAVEKKLGKRKLLAAVYKISGKAEEHRLC